MRTNYYCKKCDTHFYEEERPPNMNRIHYECGSAVFIVNHESGKEDDRE